jgi:hypothetical protein
MKKHVKFVPLEISGTDLDAFVIELEEKLYSEFWSAEQDDSKRDEIKDRIKKNIYLALETSMK